MNFDRNTVFGFVALAVLFIGFFYFTSKERNETLKAKAIQDSIAQANAPRPDSAAAPVVNATTQDTTATATTAVGFEGAERGAEQLTTVSTELATYSFSNKGGQLKRVELKNFNNQQGNPVQLIDPSFDKIEYPIAVNANKTVTIDKLFFGAPEVTKNADGSQQVRFTLAPEGTGKSITHEFTIRPDDYMLDFTISMQGRINCFLRAR